MTKTQTNAMFSALAQLELEIRSAMRMYEHAKDSIQTKDKDAWVSYHTCDHLLNRTQGIKEILRTV